MQERSTPPFFFSCMSGFDLVTFQFTLMKQFLLSLLGVVFFSVIASAQITTPIIKAGFGVDADLRANFFNGFVQSGNDDWFNNGIAGTGLFVIDTTGAAAVVAGYLSDANPWPKRMAPLYRSMSRPKFSLINNRIGVPIMLRAITAIIWLAIMDGIRLSCMANPSITNPNSPAWLRANEKRMFWSELFL